MRGETKHLRDAPRERLHVLAAAQDAVDEDGGWRRPRGAGLLGPSHQRPLNELIRLRADAEHGFASSL